MSVFRRHAKLFTIASAIAIAIPVAASLAQNAADLPKVPDGPTPLHAPMAPLTRDQMIATTARGGGGGATSYDSTRTDFDKALPNPYVVNQAWYTMPKGRFIGGASAIQVDRDGVSIWVVERCGGGGSCSNSHVDPVIHFGANGKIITMFGHDMIAYPHGIYVDKADNIWVGDTESDIGSYCPDCTIPSNPPAPGAAPGRGGNVSDFNRAHPGGAQVLKFSNKGKLLMRLGVPGVYGNDQSHFSMPSDVVTDDAGNIYVADGHDGPPANDRIVKFDKTGKYIKEWRICLPWQPHQIDCGHSIFIDSQQRLFTANRGNDLIDVWDTDGNILAEWGNWGKSSGLYIDKNDIMYSADSESGNGNHNAFEKGVHIGSARTGIVTAFIPDPLGNPTPWSSSRLSPEGVTADKNGVVYTSSVSPPGLMKWTIATNTPPIRMGGGGGGGGAGAAAAGGRGGRGARGGAAAPAPAAGGE